MSEKTPDIVVSNVATTRTIKTESINNINDTKTPNALTSLKLQHNIAYKSQNVANKSNHKRIKYNVAKGKEEPTEFLAATLLTAKCEEEEIDNVVKSPSSPSIVDLVQNLDAKNATIK